MPESIHSLTSILLNLDHNLEFLFQEFGILSHVVLFLIIFLETGLVFTPFLPGDMLLVAAGAFSATGSFRTGILFGSLSLASVLGDNLNYWIGSVFGRALTKRESGWINRRHVEKTHHFFDSYGPKLIVFARFLPVLRAFAPFVAGIGKMEYKKFFIYSVIGGVVWVGSCLATGYFLGNLIEKQYVSLAVLAGFSIILVPLLIKFIRSLGKE